MIALDLVDEPHDGDQADELHGSRRRGPGWSRLDGCGSAERLDGGGSAERLDGGGSAERWK